MPNLGSGVTWILFTLFVLVFAYGFYLLIERPAHRLSRRVYGLLIERSPLASRPALS